MRALNGEVEIKCGAGGRRKGSRNWRKGSGNAEGNKPLSRTVTEEDRRKGEGGEAGTAGVPLSGKSVVYYSFMSNLTLCPQHASNFREGRDNRLVQGKLVKQVSTCHYSPNGKSAIMHVPG